MLGGGCLGDHAPVAQRVEHLTTDQKAGGSNPSGRASLSDRSLSIEDFVARISRGGEQHED